MRLKIATLLAVAIATLFSFQNCGGKPRTVLSKDIASNSTPSAAVSKTVSLHVAGLTQASIDLRSYGLSLSNLVFQIAFPDVDFPNNEALPTQVFPDGVMTLEFQQACDPIWRAEVIQHAPTTGVSIDNLEFDRGYFILDTVKQKEIFIGYRGSAGNNVNSVYRLETLDFTIFAEAPGASPTQFEAAVCTQLNSRSAAGVKGIGFVGPGPSIPQ